MKQTPHSIPSPTPNSYGNAQTPFMTAFQNWYFASDRSTYKYPGENMQLDKEKGSIKTLRHSRRRRRCRTLGTRRQGGS
jgi:hypothetical protein